LWITKHLKRVLKWENLLNTLNFRIIITERGIEPKLLVFYRNALFDNICSKKSVKDVQKSGKICILDVEIEGVKSLKKTDLSPRFVFIKPPNMETLVKIVNQI